MSTNPPFFGLRTCFQHAELKKSSRRLRSSFLWEILWPTIIRGYGTDPRILGLVSTLTLTFMIPTFSWYLMRMWWDTELTIRCLGLKMEHITGCWHPPQLPAIPGSRCRAFRNISKALKCNEEQREPVNNRGLVFGQRQEAGRLEHVIFHAEFYLLQMKKWTGKCSIRYTETFLGVRSATVVNANTVPHSKIVSSRLKSNLTRF